MIGISVRLHSYGALLLGRVYKILHIVAAVFSQHDGQRHAMVQVRAGIVGVGAVGIFAAGLLRCDPDVEDCGVFQNFRAVTVCSAVLSVSCTALGILISILAGTPVGSTIVAVDILAFLICSALGRARGGEAG